MGPTRALLWLSFGSPERPEDIWPFLERVVAGRGVPRDRLAIVHDQYLATGGSSPLNALNRTLIERTRAAFDAADIDLPIVFGNRNWDPLVDEAVKELGRLGATDVLVFATSAYGSYSGCRQYREDVERTNPPFTWTKVPPFAGHPRFLAAQREILASFLATHDLDPEHTFVVATAHSIPVAMAANSQYQRQLAEVRAALNQVARTYGLVVEEAYQSRSGDPRTPWLEPDVGDAIDRAASERTLADVVCIPIGFLSDHQEVRYDLDILARERAEARGARFWRLETIGEHGPIPEIVTDFTQAWLEGRDLRSLLPSEPALCTGTCCQPLHARPSRSVSGA
ncbi:Ferrochelatase [Acidimicrobium ferrooxidans DSM 10331]|uniref:coproporphyrin ferrochelatase n=2 Tax=Acidimicrobium ferrooxidans TaxID=53635 RepID=C7M0D4_ACIFD|nr:Ferrochelatase [Acidimicrobium ferrooxidans DSM 10331]